jgi:MoaA/NifB/PqqE/SkfB family radical SAM enzyme
MKLDLGSARSAPARTIDPRRYHEAADPKRPPVAERSPVCLYLEVTNRCNLLCTTCPRTYEALEPPADMSWDLFTRIVGQVPDLARAVLHGVGEPMLVRSLPAMVRHLKERGVHVLFNTNGTALNERNGRALIEARLDELRVSLDAATRESFRTVRGADVFDRILRNVRRFRDLQGREDAPAPRVSLWLTGLKETLAELPAFVRLAADIGVSEVYLQRLVFFHDDPVGLALPDQTLFEALEGEEMEILAEAEAEARRLGVTFSASGAVSEPGASLTPATRENPWSLCGRPWTLMYFTANGRALPCCIAPFAQHGYHNYTLGDATLDPLEAIWNGARYQAFRAALQSDEPPRACASCGLRWSL